MVKKNQLNKTQVVKEEVTKKTEATTTEEPEFKGSLSLGSNVSSKVVGRNKSGMPWKKSSSRSQFSKGPPIAYLKSMAEKERQKRIQERVARLRSERGNDKKEKRIRQKEKAERKKINEFKSSSYQVIENLHKTRKWSVKARKTLAKMPAEAFYAKYS